MAIIRSKDFKKIERWKHHAINGGWEKIEKMGNLGFYMPADQDVSWVKNCWEGEDCIVIGSSTALEDFDLNKLEGLHTILINHLIEKWDKSEWWICLDDRFFCKTNYDITKYKGKCFTSVRCRSLPENDNIRFVSNGRRGQIPERLEQGLYGMLTGAAAINLAVITGAKNIYLLGLDDSKEFIEKAKDKTDEHLNYHVKDYTGEISTKTYYMKYPNSRLGFKKFLKWHHKIIDVCKNGQMDWFKQISLTKFENEILPKMKKENKEKIEIKQKDMTICHVASLKDIESMGDISRYVYDKSIGNHIFAKINDPMPKADIYFLECMLNQYDKYINFQRPYPKAKVISIVHTSSKCMPASCSDYIVALTKQQKSHLGQYFGEKKIKVIYAGIDSTKYNKKIDYSTQNFGRITRWSPGKVHPEWEKIARNILEEFPQSKYYMITNKVNNVKHDRVEYINDIRAFEHEKKIEALSKFNMFCDMHNTFVETASLCMMEAMATGQCYILYSAIRQIAMEEILGEAGIVCETKEEFVKTIKEILPDTQLKVYYGLKAKERIKMFSVKKMIDDYNLLFQEVIK